MQRLRTYTVEEANRELPRVRPIVAQIAELSALRPDLEEQLRMAEYSAQRPSANGDDHERAQQAHDAVNGAEEELPVEAQYIGRTIQTTDNEIIEVKLKEIDANDQVLLVERV